MKPGGGGKPTGAIADQINKDFGSYDEFKKQVNLERCRYQQLCLVDVYFVSLQFEVAGNTAFGSGWAWLSWDGSKLVRVLVFIIPMLNEIVRWLTRPSERATPSLMCGRI